MTAVSSFGKQPLSASPSPVAYSFNGGRPFGSPPPKRVGPRRESSGVLCYENPIKLERQKVLSTVPRAPTPSLGAISALDARRKRILAAAMASYGDTPGPGAYGDTSRVETSRSLRSAGATMGRPSGQQPRRVRAARRRYPSGPGPGAHRYGRVKTRHGDFVGESTLGKTRSDSRMRSSVSFSMGTSFTQSRKDRLPKVGCQLERCSSNEEALQPDSRSLSFGQQPLSTRKSAPAYTLKGHGRLADRTKELIRANYPPPPSTTDTAPVSSFGRKVLSTMKRSPTHSF